MKIDEIERSMPNGFHDSTLLKIEVDYLKREAVLSLQIDVGEFERKENADESLYRKGKLH